VLEAGPDIPFQTKSAGQEGNRICSGHSALAALERADPFNA
jgi:hypothetical protein